MRPQEGDHPAAGPQRPGGGTYPVRPAVTAPPADPAAAERTARPQPQPQVRQVVSPYRHTSPRSFLLLLLMAFALVTLVLIAFAVSGYLPQGNRADEPETAPAPTDDAPET